MKQRFLRLGLLLACAVSVLSGCEWIDHNVRPRASDDEPRPPEVATDPEVSKSFFSEPEAPKSFFKSSRLSGAMSSEGRDIERSLGIQ
jgi:hypothetical protein